MTQAVSTKTKFLAVVETNYTTYAIGDTREEARELALRSAYKWLKSRDVTYSSPEEVEEYLGCNIFEIPVGQAVQEY